MISRKKRQRYKITAAKIAAQLGLSINLNSWEEIWNFLDKVGELEYIYIIGEGGGDKVKIGKSKSPQQRLKSIQTGYPNKLYLWGYCINKSPYTEKEIHLRLKSYRLVGEWFKLSPQVLGLVEEIRSQGFSESSIQYKSMEENV